MAETSKRRQKKERVYRSFVWQKPLPAKKTSLQSPLKLWLESFKFCRRNLRPFAVLAVGFFIAALVLLFSGGGNESLIAIRDEFSQRYGAGFAGEVSTSLAMLSESVNALVNRLTQSFGWFVILNLFAGLSVLWLIRNLYRPDRGRKVKIREAVYFGPAQLVPFAALGLLLLLQLLPSLIVADFGAQLRENGVLQTNLEQAAAVAVILSFVALSFYWLAGGVFSLIIVSLPGAKPFDAWQTALHLVHRRRLPAAGRLFLFGAGATLAVCLLALPVGRLLPQWSEHFIYLASSCFFVVGHIYCFLLYQDLLTAKTLN
ncbi:hypothetical protein F4X86_04305 [Candidatus Saccharibacteria bacterium]|nr:hypothetical protein [Candidatus Saccharibacteria bacterium]